LVIVAAQLAVLASPNDVARHVRRWIKYLTPGKGPARLLVEGVMRGQLAKVPERAVLCSFDPVENAISASSMKSFGVYRV
jgi:hypothetical protein